MTLTEDDKFEQFLSASFADRNYRELRLSTLEAEYLTIKYPNATLQKCQAEEYPDGKRWYVVNL